MTTDLGYGTTWTYLGHAKPEQAVVVKRYDGQLIPVAERQLRAFALALVHGNREAGIRMGLAEQTVKNMVGLLYRRLGAFGKWEAADILGWVRIPPELLDASPEADTTGGRSVAGQAGDSLSPAAPRRGWW